MTAEETLEKTIRNINKNWDYGKDAKECFKQFWFFFDPSPGKSIIEGAMQDYARQVGEAVKKACIDELGERSNCVFVIKDIKVEDFLK